MLSGLLGLLRRSQTACLLGDNRIKSHGNIAAMCKLGLLIGNGALDGFKLLTSLGVCFAGRIHLAHGGGAFREEGANALRGARCR